jgi:cation transport ATPase
MKQKKKSEIERFIDKMQVVFVLAIVLGLAWNIWLANMQSESEVLFGDKPEETIVRNY